MTAETSTEALHLRSAVRLLRGALQGLLGVSDPKELEDLRSVVLGDDVACDEDKTVAVAAIDALLITEGVRT